MELAKGFQENLSFFSIDLSKVSEPMDHNKLWKTLNEMGI